MTMAYKKADLVQETSSSTGSTTMVLAGATSNKRRRFRDAMSNGDTCTVLIEHATAAEAQICDATYASDVLTIGTVLWSTTGSAINFSAGVKTITNVGAASRMVMMDPNGDAAVTRNLAVGYQMTAQGNVTFGSSLNLTLPHKAGGPLNFADSAVGGQTMQIGWGAGNGAQTFNFYNVTGNNYPLVVTPNGGVGIGLTPSTGYLFETLTNADATQYIGQRNSSTGPNAAAVFIQDVGGRYTARHINYTGQFLLENSSGLPTRYSDFDTHYFRTTAGVQIAVIGAGVVRPGGDNGITCGDPSYRWSVVYAGTGSINTSGRDAKLEIVEASAAEREWARLIRERGPRRYKLKDAVDAKGDAARWHFGYVVEDILADAETAGIVDPWRYAFLCRDRKTERETYTETEMREKRRTVTVEETAIEVRDGMPVRVRKSVEREERVGAMVALQDEQGNPVLREVRDQDGNVTGTTPVLHFVPEMEEVEVERFRDVETDEWQYGLRYSELEAFLACAA